MMTFTDTYPQDPEFPRPMRTPEALLLFCADGKEVCPPSTPALRRSAPLTKREQLIRNLFLSVIICGGGGGGMILCLWAGGLLK